MIRRVAFAAIWALLVIGSGISSHGIEAAQVTQNPAPQAAAQPPSGRADMMKMHEQMMAEMKASDAKLDALVKDMNAAAGENKINAIVAVVNELVRQNKAMHEHMGQMHQQIMGGRGMMMR
jgi:hypothetical protein